MSLIHSQAWALDVYGFGTYWQKEDTDGSGGLGLGASIPILTEHLRADGRVYFFEDSDIRGDDKLELYPVEFGLQLHLMPAAPLDPYILGGASYTYADADRYDVDSDFGAYAGVGVDYKVFPFVKFFAEAIYKSVEVSAERGKIDESLDLSGVSANLGVKFHF